MISTYFNHCVTLGSSYGNGAPVPEFSVSRLAERSWGAPVDCFVTLLCRYADPFGGLFWGLHVLLNEP